MEGAWGLDTMTVWQVDMEHRRVPHCWQVGDLEIFGEDGPGRELHSGQTDGVQEVGGPEATCPRAQPPKALLASSHLVEHLCEMGLHSGRSVVKKGPCQTGTENRGVSPRNLVDSL